MWHFVLYMSSSASGVERGIKWLSGFNLVLAGLLLLAVALLGPTSFIFDTFTTSLGSYLDQLVRMSLRMSPFSASTWRGWPPLKQGVPPGMSSPCTSLRTN